MQARCIEAALNAPASSAETRGSIQDELYRAIKHTAYANGTVIVDVGFLERCLSALPPVNSVVVSRECAERSLTRASYDMEPHYDDEINRLGEKDHNELKAAIDWGAK